MKKNTSWYLISLTLVLLLGLNEIYFNPFTMASENKATVYVVLACDLEPDQDHTQSAQHPIFTVDTIRPGSSSVVGQIMDSDFRNALKDSFDNMLKMSWFVEMDAYMAAGIWPQQENVSGFGALLETMRKYWSLQMGTYGDELAYHHHFLYYYGWWRAFYPGIDNLPDTYTFHDDYLDRMILDYNFYPSAFRAGWRWLNENVSRWLNEWLPYDFSGQNSTDAYFPYHPQGFSFWRIADATNATEAFIYATQGLPTILFGSGHNELGDLPSSIEYTHEILTRLSEEYDVQFRYCTAREALQRYLMDMGYTTDMTSPALTVIRNGDNYSLASNETLWMNHPRVTAKYMDGTYSKIVAIPAGTDRWNASVPSWSYEGASLEKIGFAALDVWGNPSTLIILPRSHTFGHNSTMKEGWYDARGHIVGGSYVCPVNGSARSISVYVKNLGQAKRAKSGLYLPDHDGKIGTLVASTEERIIPVGEGWQSFNFSAGTNVLLNANQTYWIVVFIEWAGFKIDAHSFLIFADQSSSQDVVGGRWYPYGDFPEVFPLDQMVESSWKLSIYCTYIQLPR